MDNRKAYKLADGSLSTDYDLGDEIEVVRDVGCFLKAGERVKIHSNLGDAHLIVKSLSADRYRDGIWQTIWSNLIPIKQATNTELKEWVPPVGCECEFYDNKAYEKTPETKGWLDGDPLKVICDDFSHKAVAVKNIRLEEVAILIPECLRLAPKKTQADVEREDAVENMFKDAEVVGSRRAFEKLVDKGYHNGPKVGEAASFCDIQQLLQGTDLFRSREAGEITNDLLGKFTITRKVKS